MIKFSFLEKIIYALVIITIIFLLFFNEFIFRLDVNFFSLTIIITIIIGFFLMIYSIISYFLNINEKSLNNKILHLKILNECTTKIILIIIMIILSFIPPISFTQSIIDWRQIGFLNYIRGVSFLIGSLYLPGSSIFNILFHNTNLHKKFGIEPYFLKITIIPILSLSFLGTTTLILDFFKLSSGFFSFFLFYIILFLFFIEIIYLRLKFKEHLKIRFTNIKLSKSSITLLVFIVGILFVAFASTIIMRYLIPGDVWRGVSFAYFIGSNDTNYTDKFYNYTDYWGYIIFSLSKLAGLPYVNTNVLLFPYLYLYPLTVFLMMKSILKDLHEKYSMLSTFFFIIFSGLNFLFEFGNSWTLMGNFAIEGLLIFDFRSYAYFSLFLSLAFFIISTKISNKNYYYNNNFQMKLKILSSFFFFQSFATYFLPAIPAFLFIFIYTFFAKVKKVLKLHFFILFSIFFILYDLFSTFYFSWITTTFLGYFTDINFHINDPLFFTRLLFNALIVYLTIISILSFLFLIYKFNFKKFKFKNSSNYNQSYAKILFKITLSIFTILYIIAIVNKVFFNYNGTFFMYYLDLIIFNIGIIGFLGIFLSFLCYKKNKTVFKILSLWSISLFLLASFFIYINWFSYPLMSPYEIPESKFNNMMYWFTRIWIYSIIPLSIIASIGLIKALKKIQLRVKILKKIPNLFSIFFIIILSFSNIIIGAIGWNNLYSIHYYFDDDEAQIIGWCSENIPRSSNILIDRFLLYHMEDIIYSKTYYLNELIKEAVNNHTYVEKFIIFNYLKEMSIKYLILSSNDNGLKIETENYINIYTELIPDFFNNTLYKYGDLSVYYANY